MSLSFYGKRPGPGFRLDKLSMQFAVDETGWAGSVLEAYERLILDAVKGNHTLFTTAEGVERLWEISQAAARRPAAGPAVRRGLVGPQPGPPADRPARLAAAVRAGLAREEVARRMQLFGDLAEQYGEFGAAARGASPCFEEWALGVAEDVEVQAWLGHPAAGQAAAQPGVRRRPVARRPRPRPVRRPAAGPPGRHAARSAPRSCARSTQTNEVGRLATLVPALGLVARESGEPLVLLEVGASAGLCLFPDRYRYRWVGESGGDRARRRPRADLPGERSRCRCPASCPWWPGGAASTSTRCRCVTPTPRRGWRTWSGPSRRTGCGPCTRPSRWPPRSRRTSCEGNLLDELPALLEVAEGFGQVVVFHSAVIAYLEDAERRRFADLMRGLVASCACHWISNESPGVLPEVTATGPAIPEDQIGFVLGLDGQAVGLGARPRSRPDLVVRPTRGQSDGPPAERPYRPARVAGRSPARSTGSRREDDSWSRARGKPEGICPGFPRVSGSAPARRRTRSRARPPRTARAPASGTPSPTSRTASSTARPATSPATTTTATSRTSR